MRESLGDADETPTRSVALHHVVDPLTSQAAGAFVVALDDAYWINGRTTVK
jgi:hypothetical protein